MKKPLGFTLIEVLIAVALTAALLTALYASFFSVLKSQAAIDSQVERSREVTRFIDAFSREVESAFFKDYNNRTAFAGEREAAGARTMSRVTFTAFSYPAFREAGPRGDLVAIRYYAEESAPGVMTLYREAWNPYSGGEKKSGFKAEVIEGIEGFEVSYFNGADWAGTWDAKTDKRLPEAVSAVISVRDRGEVIEYPVTARTMIR